MRTPAAAKGSSASRSRSALERYPFLGSGLEQRVELDSVVRPGRSCTPAVGIPRLGSLTIGADVDVLALPQDLVVQDELMLVFDESYRNPETGVPALPLETQRVCSSKTENTFSS